MATIITGRIYHIPIHNSDSSFLGVVPIKQTHDPQAYYCLPVYSEPTDAAPRQIKLGYTLPRGSKQWIVSKDWLLKHNPQLLTQHLKPKMQSSETTKRNTPKARFLRQLDQQIKRIHRAPIDDRNNTVPHPYSTKTMIRIYQGGGCSSK